MPEDNKEVMFIAKPQYQDLRQSLARIEGMLEKLVGPPGAKQAQEQNTEQTPKPLKPDLETDPADSPGKKLESMRKGLGGSGESKK